MAEINNALALYVKPPQIDLATPLLTAAKLREAESQNALARLQIDTAQERRNALADYKRTGDMDTLRGQPDLQAQIVQIRGQLDEQSRKRWEEGILKNARGAQRIAGISDPAERAAAWKEELDAALADKRISEADYRRMSGMQPNSLMLDRIIRSGLTLQQQIELEQKEKDRATGQRVIEAVAPVLGGTVPTSGTPAATGPQASALPRGLRNNNPLNIEAGKFTEGLPGFAGSDGRFAKFASIDDGIAAADRLLASYGKNQGIDTVAGVINRWAPATENNTGAYANFVAGKIGVKPGDKIDLGDPGIRKQLIGAMAEFENGRPLAAGNVPASVNPSSSRLVQALPQLQTLRMMPGLPDSVAKGLDGIIEHARKLSEPTGDIKEYQLYVAQETAAGRPPDDFTTWARKNKESGSTKTTVNIDQKAESAIETERGKGLGQQLNKIAEAGIEAADQEALVGRLGALLEQSGTGAGVAFTNWVRENTGIKLSEKADAAEAANAIINYLKPRMRAPGSGASSDRDMAIFARAIPSLLSTPDGKRIIVETLGGMYAIQRARGEVAQRWQVGDLTAKQAMEEIRKLPDPFQSFREWQLQAEGKGGRQAEEIKTPNKGDVIDGYEFLGGNPADKNNYRKIETK